ncbi:MAG TPA: hypothetical protein ENK06_05710 [Gammaproteobacteria bacterium]|nr:hypothetical protein [Gammaproteobacteria bacterium]
MASNTQMPVVLKDDEEHHNDATLYYTVYSSADRTKRAVTALLGCWAIAGVSIFIPIAHFALVPGFLIAGPIMAYSRLKMSESKEKVVGVCPRHNGEVSIKLENTDTIPKYTYCPECDGSIQIVPKSSK